jgi:serine/threonine protein phosphatase PrpC
VTAETPLRFAAQTDVGKQRNHNEDNYLVDRKLRLYVVCDGMGGHAAGEVASAVAVRTLSEEIRKHQDLLDDYVKGSTGAGKVSKRDITNMLAFAVNCASRKIHAEATSDEKKRGMGTTLVAMLFLSNQAFIIHVGDSRVYLLRNSNLEQLTEDHNVYNEFIKKKKIDLGSAAKLAPKQAITRAVGVYEHCEPETLVIDVAPGDRFLLCTDGLSGYFRPRLGGDGPGVDRQRARWQGQHHRGAGCAGSPGGGQRGAPEPPGDAEVSAGGHAAVQRAERA